MQKLQRVRVAGGTPRKHLTEFTYAELELELKSLQDKMKKEIDHEKGCKLNETFNRVVDETLRREE